MKNNKRDMTLKTKYLLSIVSILIITTLVSSHIHFSKIAYSVSIDNKVIGIVREEESLDRVIKDIKNEMKNKYNKEIKLGKEINIEKIRAGNDDIASEEAIKGSLYDVLDFKTDAYTIKVDGNDLVYLEKKEDAENILQELEDKYLTEGEEVKNIGFVEKVEIELTEVKINKSVSPKDALSYILSGGEEIQKYRIKSGDTAWDIAFKYDIGLEDLSAANGDTNLEKLKIGQEISLTIPKPYINVKTIETKEYEEKIPFKLKYEKSSNIYIGEKKIKRKGEEGKKKVNVELVNVNGALKEKNIIDEEVLQEPIDAIVLKGTKERPKTMAYGTFNLPSRGKVSSRFGSRWGKSHKGIDISGPIGTTINAADGGKVISTGWINGYGNTVVIDHENGYKTLYAHANTIKVKKGQRVYKGQAIATIGTSGRVTGPNLHFEVKKNNVPVDPLKYIKK